MRESVSEAGPRWLNQGTSGGLAALLSAPATERSERGLVGGRCFGPGKRRHGCAAMWKGSLAPVERFDRKVGEQSRRDRKHQRSRFAARAREENAQRGSSPSPDRQVGSPFAGKASTMVAAGARGTPIRGTIRGRVYRHKRLAGVNVHGVAPKLAQTVRVAKQGPKTVVRPAQAGSCPGNWRFHRVPVFDNSLVAEIGKRCLLTQRPTTR